MDGVTIPDEWLLDEQGDGGGVCCDWGTIVTGWVAGEVTIGVEYTTGVDTGGEGDVSRMRPLV